MMGDVEISYFFRVRASSKIRSSREGLEDPHEQNRVRYDTAVRASDALPSPWRGPCHRGRASASTAATVYVIGRSVCGQPATDNLPGAIEESAEEVTRRGGQGIALRYGAS